MLLRSMPVAAAGTRARSPYPIFGIPGEKVPKTQNAPRTARAPRNRAAAVIPRVAARKRVGEIGCGYRARICASAAHSRFNYAHGLALF